MPSKKTPVRTPRAKASTPIEDIKHQDTRVNIPTEELRGFVSDDEAKPRTMAYPRDAAKAREPAPEATLFVGSPGNDHP